MSAISFDIQQGKRIKIFIVLSYSDGFETKDVRKKFLKAMDKSDSFLGEGGGRGLTNYFTPCYSSQIRKHR
jgi:hypothetical protein